MQFVELDDEAAAGGPLVDTRVPLAAPLARRNHVHELALIVETAFPNRLAPLAKASGHLTPEMLGQEITKMPADLPIWVYHIKPQLYQETAEELAKIDPSRIHILEQGKTYTL